MGFSGKYALIIVERPLLVKVLKHWHTQLAGARGRVFRRAGGHRSRFGSAAPQNVVQLSLKIDLLGEQIDGRVLVI